ncbi:MAG: RNA-binding protein [archaeon]
MSSNNNTLKIINSKQVIDLIKESKRIDGRSLNDFRNLEIIPNTISSADGSAWVKLGESEVLCGIKFAVGDPFVDNPNEGSIMTNFELSELASPDFETGPPGMDAIEYGRIVDKVIRSSECIDFEALCIVPGEKVFLVFIDIYAINADGNLIDAAQFAAMSALLNARIPKLNEDNEIIKEYTSKTLAIDVSKIPVSITFSKIEDKLVIDANIMEEYSSSSRFSVGVCKNNIVSIQKSGGSSYSEAEVNYMFDIAASKYEAIKKKIIG